MDYPKPVFSSSSSSSSSTSSSEEKVESTRWSVVEFLHPAAPAPLSCKNTLLLLLLLLPDRCKERGPNQINNGAGSVNSLSPKLAAERATEFGKIFTRSAAPETLPPPQKKLLPEEIGENKRRGGRVCQAEWGSVMAGIDWSENCKSRKTKKKRYSCNCRTHKTTYKQLHSQYHMDD